PERLLFEGLVRQGAAAEGLDLAAGGGVLLLALALLARPLDEGVVAATQLAVAGEGLLLVLEEDDAALDLLAVVGLEGLAEVVLAEAEAVADQAGGQQTRADDVLTPLGQVLVVAAQHLLDEAVAVDVEAADLLGEGALDLGGGDGDAAGGAGPLQDALLD